MHHHNRRNDMLKHKALQAHLSAPRTTDTSLARKQMLGNTSRGMPIRLTLPGHPIHPLLTQLGQSLCLRSGYLIRNTILTPITCHTLAPRSR